MRGLETEMQCLKEKFINNKSLFHHSISSSKVQGPVGNLETRTPTCQVTAVGIYLYASTRITIESSSNSRVYIFAEHAALFH